MKIDWDSAARVRLRNIDRQNAMRILHAIADYARTGQGDVKALHGPLAGRLRLRAGDWRVILRREQESIRILDIDTRGDAYR